MTREAFEQETLNLLAEHRRQHPALEPRDEVKFLFQGLLGVGHLLSSREAVADYLLREMAALAPESPEPLWEQVSPAWCRLNLRSAAARGLTPQVIAGLMLTSASPLDFTRQDVQRLCREAGIRDEALLRQIPEADWLPSHTGAYREAYQPAYRLISAAWCPCLEAVAAIAGKARDTDRLLVTIDGPCACGKTTLAGQLAEVFQAPVVHTDDYVIPHAQKTPERLAIPGGNYDAQRLMSEVITPWSQHLPAVVRRYDCAKDCLAPDAPLPDSPLLFLEGCCSNLPALRALAGIRLFLDVPRKERIRRLTQRESADSLKQFHTRWIPLEDAYFGAFGLPDAGCLVLRL